MMQSLTFCLNNPLFDCFLKLVLSMIVGSILGIERRMTQHFVGIRTFVLIAVSSCLLMQISIFMGNLWGADSSRIAAQVVSGIGFIGAGTILHHGLNVKGITTAAIIWTASALGLAIGAGLIVPSFVALVIVVLCLIFFSRIEKDCFSSELTKVISLEFCTIDVDFDKIKKCFKDENFLVTDMSISENIKEKETKVVFSVKSFSKGNVKNLLKSLKTLEDLEKISFKEK